MSSEPPLLYEFLVSFHQLECSPVLWAPVPRDVLLQCSLVFPHVHGPGVHRKENKSFGGQGVLRGPGGAGGEHAGLET